MLGMQRFISPIFSVYPDGKRGFVGRCLKKNLAKTPGRKELVFASWRLCEKFLSLVHGGSRFRQILACQLPFNLSQYAPPETSV